MDAASRLDLSLDVYASHEMLGLQIAFTVTTYLYIYMLSISTVFSVTLWALSHDWLVDGCALSSH